MAEMIGAVLNSPFWAIGLLIRRLNRKKKEGVIVDFAKLPQELKDMINTNPRALPRLPVPPLEHTLKQYLASVKPLCGTAAEYAEQEKLCDEFKNGVGAELHAWVEKEDKHEGYPFSFIEKSWDGMYYGDRSPAPVNFSPFFAIADEKNVADMSQLTRAAKFIYGFTLWSRMILAGKLEPDKNMCSMAYPKHFSSAKIPKKGMDELVMYPESRHVTVVCNGQLFTVEVVSEDGSVLDVAGISVKLSEVMKIAQTAGAGSVPYLTSRDRQSWAAAREALEREPGNKEKLLAVDAGIICVCLDDKPAKAGDLKERAQRLLVGPGHNRWWDKQQLIVDGSGFMGIAFEHSYGDGTNWGRFIKDVMMQAEGKGDMPVLPTHSASSAPAPTLIQLKVSIQVERGLPMDVGDYIHSSMESYRAVQKTIDLEVVDFTAFGKNEIKTWNCSPDAVMQLCFMATYYQLHGAMPPVYEACATRGFFHGRTETIRSCTEAAMAFSKALTTNGPKAETLALMQAAAKMHSGVSKLAATGSGIDRHFTAMANSAAACGKSIPLFEHAKFKESKTWMLSTSNGSGPYLQMFGFAAVNPNGYGLGYLIENDKLNIVVSSFEATTRKTSSKKMATGLEATLKKMQVLTAPASPAVTPAATK